MVNIGFDLDMTLVNSSKAIFESAVEALNDFDLVAPEGLIEQSIGLPLLVTLKNFTKNDLLAKQVFERYQEIYLERGFLRAFGMPNARETVDLIRSQGHRVVIITAKNSDLAHKQLTHCEIKFDELVGSAFSGGKAEAMLKTECVLYVGDHEADFQSARSAGVEFIGILTNPYSNLQHLTDQHMFKTISSFLELVPFIAGKFKD